MPAVVVERLDHLGIIAGVIKDLGLIPACRLPADR